MKAFVFPGQGAQKTGIGGALFDEFHELTEASDRILGYSIKELCLENPDNRLSQTQYTQPALYVVNALHYYKKITDTGERPAFTAGHSLGEYSALLAAGAFNFEIGLRLVQKRGELMAKAKDGAMAAVLGLDYGQIKKIIEKEGLGNIDIANLNSPYQTVLSGPKNDIITAQQIFESSGCKLYIPLNVSGAFHSRLMEDARNEFAQFLSQFSFSQLTISVISNVLARPYTNERIKELLADQITHSVKWTESICWLMGKGVREFTEIGPGNILTKLITKIKKEAEPLVEDEEKNDESPRTFSLPANRKQFIFMYAGQGAQYYHMGRELYFNNHIFKENMDLCNSLLQHHLEKSLIDVIYDDTKRFEEFDNILYTHPALFSIAYSLTKTLKYRGIKPDGVLGYSAGEYAAAVTAGVLSLEDGLCLVMEQAQMLHTHYDKNDGMLVVFDRPGVFDENMTLFQDCTLAGINFNNCFIVSGSKMHLNMVKSELSSRSINAYLLPVQFAFHSAAMDRIKDEFSKVSDNLPLRTPRIPLFSSARGEQIHTPEPGWLWEVIRNKIKFIKTIEAITGQGECVFIDVSATGTLANFIKYGYQGALPSYSTINQFGQNNKTLDHLINNLGEYQEVLVNT